MVKPLSRTGVPSAMPLASSMYVRNSGGLLEESLGAGEQKNQHGQDHERGQPNDPDLQLRPAYFFRIRHGLDSLLHELGDVGVVRGLQLRPGRLRRSAGLPSAP